MTPLEILRARLKLRLTQAELAPLLGYSDVARVSELERGARKPGAAIVLLLRAYLDGYRPPNWPGYNGPSYRQPRTNSRSRPCKPH
jgi:transcriptional regulator with XRE-family HTH domain